MWTAVHIAVKDLRLLARDRVALFWAFGFPVLFALFFGAVIRYNVPSNLKLRHGVVSDEILREVRLGDYDLVITGSPESTRGLKKLLLGDVVEDVIKHTTCPFLIVKKPLTSTA